MGGRPLAGQCVAFDSERILRRGGGGQRIISCQCPSFAPVASPAFATSGVAKRKLARAPPPTSRSRNAQFWLPNGRGSPSAVRESPSAIYIAVRDSAPVDPRGIRGLASLRSA